MNIFYIDEQAENCAKWAVDSHCVKMILESAQLLSTAHRLLDGIQYVENKPVAGIFPVRYRKIKRWLLPDARETAMYSATHVNHPCAIWARESHCNYAFLWVYLAEHCKEYTHRYGKVHKIESSGLLTLLADHPNNMTNPTWSEPPSAMDTKYIISEDPIINYRNYYKYGKAHLHKWKNRQAPAWIMEN
jgi:hypothetical protein